MLEEIKEGKSRIIELEPDLRIVSPDNDYLEKYREKRLFAASNVMSKNSSIKPQKIFENRTREWV
jgi:hypothetical protein